MLAKVVMRAQVSLSIRRVRRYRSKFASALGHTHDEGESGGRRDPADTGVLVSCRELLSAGWDGFGLAAGCWWDVKRRFWYFWTSWVVCSGLEAICSVVQGWVPVKKRYTQTWEPLPGHGPARTRTFSVHLTAFGLVPEYGAAQSFLCNVKLSKAWKSQSHACPRPPENNGPPL